MVFSSRELIRNSFCQNFFLFSDPCICLSLILHLWFGNHYNKTLHMLLCWKRYGVQCGAGWLQSGFLQNSSTDGPSERSCSHAWVFAIWWSPCRVVHVRVVIP